MSTCCRPTRVLTMRRQPSWTCAPAAVRAARAQSDRRLLRFARRAAARERRRHRPVRRRQRRHARRQGDQGGGRADDRAGHDGSRAPRTTACRTARSPPARRPRPAGRGDRREAAGVCPQPSTLLDAAGESDADDPAGERRRAALQGHLRHAAQARRPRLQRLQGQDLPAPRAAAHAGAADRASLGATSSGCAQDADEVGLLFRDLLIGVTSFFRDAEAFEALEPHGHPAAVRGHGRRRHGARLGARAAPPARRPIRSPSCCASTWPTLDAAAQGADLRHRHRRAGAGRRARRALSRGAARRHVRRSGCSASSARTAAATCWPRRCATCASSRRTA